MPEPTPTTEKTEAHKAKIRREIRRTHIFIWILFGISAALAIFIYVQGLPPPPGKYDMLAKCIAKTSTTFYGAFWCPDCAAQKTKFGTGAQYLPYHECALPDKSENDSCRAVDVKHYPTWVFGDGSRLVGTQNVSKLAEKTGCAMPTSS